MSSPTPTVRIPEHQLEFDEHGSALLEGTPFTGIAWESPSGNMYLSEVSYEDGLAMGIARDWYDADHLAATQEFVCGSQHGEQKEWFPDGKVKLIAIWENGLRVAVRRWDESGDTIEDWCLASDDPKRVEAAKLQTAIALAYATCGGGPSKS